MQPTNLAPLPGFAAGRLHDFEQILQLLLRFVRGEGRRACTSLESNVVKANALKNCDMPVCGRNEAGGEDICQ